LFHFMHLTQIKLRFFNFLLVDFLIFLIILQFLFFIHRVWV
jgi:hypothetical protein